MPDDNALKIVFETVNLAEVTVVRSLLDGAAIPYLTRGEDPYDAFRGAFRGTVFNPRGRPVVFLVSADRADEAKRLLNGFQ